MGKSLFETLIGCGFVAFVGAMFVYRAMKQKAQARMIEDTARSKVETAAQGHGEFQGYAWPVGEPYPDHKGDGRVYYAFALQREETKGSGKNKRTEWVTRFSYGHYEPFYLVDPTGLALIDIRGADLNLTGAKTRLWNSIPPDEQAYMLKRDKIKEVPGFPPKTGLFGMFSGKYRVVENEIRVGSPLFATGDYQTAGEDSLLVQEPGLTDFTNKVIDIENRKFKDLTRLIDKNGDGQLSEVEMREGYTFAAKLSRNKAKLENSKASERHFEVYGSLQSTPDHKLLIADVHEQFLVQRLVRFKNLQLIAGWAMVICALGLPMLTLVKNLDPEKPIRQIAEANEKTRLNVGILHQRCVANDLASCSTLVQENQYYQLSKIHLKYYQDQILKIKNAK